MIGLLWILGVILLVTLAIIFAKVFVRILGGFAIVLLIVFMIFLIFCMCAGILGIWRGIFGFLFC